MRAGIGWAAATLAAMAAAGGASAAPNGSAALEGVSCTSPQACVAVGESEAPPGQSTLALQLRGGAWQVTATPEVGASPELFGVSCPAPGTCIAVGGAQHDRPAFYRRRVEAHARPGSGSFGHVIRGVLSDR
jgi:hypothetical protein